MSWALCRDRERHDVVLRGCDLGLCARGEPLLVDRLGVALDLLQRGVAAHRHDLVRRTIALRHDAAAGLAQAVRYAPLRQPGLVAARAEPSPECPLAERAAPFVDQKRQ